MLPWNLTLVDMITYFESYKGDTFADYTVIIIPRIIIAPQLGSFGGGGCSS